MKLLLSCLIIAICSIGCGEDTVTSPSSPSYIPYISQTPSPQEADPPAPAVDSTPAHANFSNDGFIATADLTANIDSWFVWACYAGPLHDLKAQELIDSSSVYLKAGEDRLLVSSLGCGNPVIQCDLATRRHTPRKPFFGEDLIAAYTEASSPPCPPPPCDNCEKTCPVPKPDSICKNQTWLDYPYCKWVGACICEPTPSECPNQIWVPYPTCTWTGECSCENPGDPCSCGSTYDSETCTYICDDCPCQDPGDPCGCGSIYDSETCTYTCDECQECVLPSEGPVSVTTGNPTTECSSLGYDVGPPNDFYIVKCGQHYEVHHSLYTNAKCQWQTRPQDVSHQTACSCPE